MKLQASPEPKPSLPFACPCGCKELEVRAKVTLQLKEGVLESHDADQHLNDSIIKCTKCGFEAPGVWFRTCIRNRHEILSLLLGHMQANFDIYWKEGAFLEQLLKTVMGLELVKGEGEDKYGLGRTAPVEERPA